MSTKVSRRLFVAAVAGGAAAIACAGRVSAQPGTPPPAKAFAFVGCYTSSKRQGRGTGISLYRVRGNGEWTLVETMRTAENPSYLITDRSASTLYAVHGDNTWISHYRIDANTRRLSPLGQLDTGGINPVHLALSPDERFVLVANYATGSVAVFPRNPDGTISPRSDLLQLHGTPGPLAEDQKGPQPHQITFDATGSHVLVPDKGTDQIHRLSYNSSSGALTEIPPAVVTHPGSGPRHLAYHPNLPVLYLVDELSSEVTTYGYDAAGSTTVQLQVTSTIPSDFHDETTAAAIAISRDGRFVHASNRGHDSIVTYPVGAGGMLGTGWWTPTGGAQPRFMTWDPTGQVLYAANQKTDSIVAFGQDQSTGGLIRVGTPVPTGTPSAIAFVSR